MIRIRQIKISVTSDNEDTLLSKVANILSISKSDIISYSIKKKSLDARKRDELHFVYEVEVSLSNEKDVLKINKNKDVFLAKDEKYTYPKSGSKVMTNRPIIIGSGPAGLYAGLLLAERGYKPLIIERGEKVEDRIKSVNTFWDSGKLNENSNVCFGEGGAGTFSDGKLNTLVKDKDNRMQKVFETFIDCGAPSEILYLNNPHIGTDKLRSVIKNLREKIISLGGEFRYNTTLTNIIIENNTLSKIELNHNEIINVSILILAIGHSAHDTFNMLLTNKLNLEAKPFAVGVRITHKQEMINERQYGAFSKYLPPATYKLTYTTSSKRGVYSFCMCPGGYVVNSSSKEGFTLVNGMSNYLRDTSSANSAIVVTVSPNDFGPNALDGLIFQQEIEHNAYLYGQGKIPCQRLKDFIDNKETISLKEKPIIKGDYFLTNINSIFPDFISSSLKEGIIYFDKIIPGFAGDDVILLAPETRTSSPIRIVRDNSFQSNIKGIYPCGEGSGYAGGITTSAMDGLKVAEAIIKAYQPLK